MKSYSDAQQSMIDGNATALDEFIVEYEPERERAREQFREMLQEVINEAILEYEKDNHVDPPSVEVMEQKNRVEWDVELVVIMIVVICCLAVLATRTVGVVGQ